MCGTTRETEARTAYFKPLQSTRAIAALGVGTERHIRKLCEDGTLKAVKSGRNWRVNTRAALEHFGLDPEECAGILA